MLKILGTYAVVLIIFLAIDLTWIGVVARDFYKTRIGDMMAPAPILSAALIFYMLYAAGLVYFAVLPALRDQNWRTALVQGAVLGLMSYATYDLTNLATLRNWSLALSLTDLAWGTVLSAVVSTLGYAIVATLS